MAFGPWIVSPTTPTWSVLLQSTIVHGICMIWHHYKYQIDVTSRIHVELKFILLWSRNRWIHMFVQCDPIWQNLCLDVMEKSDRLNRHVGFIQPKAHRDRERDVLPHFWVNHLPIFITKFLFTIILLPVSLFQIYSVQLNCPCRKFSLLPVAEKNMKIKAQKVIKQIIRHKQLFIPLICFVFSLFVLLLLVSAL